MASDVPFHLLPVVHHTVYHAIDPEGALKGAAIGQRVLVTGASRGIGKAIAIAFAAAGAQKLALVARDKKNLEQTKIRIAAASPDCLVETFAVDVSDGDRVRSTFDEIMSSWGGIDILIANAAIIDKSDSVENADPLKWWNIYEVNVKGVFNVCHAYLQCRAAMASEQRHGVIIATGDLSAGAYWKGFSAYCATKSAVHRLIEFIDAEKSEDGLKAFTFCPGGVATDMGLSIPEEEHSWLVDDVSLPAGFSVWLATTDAASFLSGRYVDCRWDLAVLMSHKDRIVEHDLLKLKIGF